MIREAFYHYKHLRTKLFSFLFFVVVILMFFHIFRTVFGGFLWIWVQNNTDFRDFPTSDQLREAVTSRLLIRLGWLSTDFHEKIPPLVPESPRTRGGIFSAPTAYVDFSCRGWKNSPPCTRIAPTDIHEIPPPPRVPESPRTSEIFSAPTFPL